MEVHNLKRGDRFIIKDEKVSIPPDAIVIQEGDILTFKNFDGMYCNCFDKHSNIVFIASWTQVELI